MMHTSLTIRIIWSRQSRWAFSRPMRVGSYALLGMCGKLSLVFFRSSGSLLPLRIDTKSSFIFSISVAVFLAISVVSSIFFLSDTSVATIDGQLLLGLYANGSHYLFGSPSRWFYTPYNFPVNSLCILRHSHSPMEFPCSLKVGTTEEMCTWSR